MLKPWLIILVHQLVFQTMFVAKNAVLQKKIGKPIRGKNREATLSIVVFAVYVGTTLVLGLMEHPVGRVRFVPDLYAMVTGNVLLLLSIVIAAASLLGLKDSWRVGIPEDQQTVLISTGIYRFTRNPYFLAYLIMFAGYTLILQNIMLLALLLISMAIVHAMIRKEEAHLANMHGADYDVYRKKVPRYLFW